MSIFDKLREALGKQSTEVFSGNPLPDSQEEIERQVAADILQQRLTKAKVESQQTVQPVVKQIEQVEEIAKPSEATGSEVSPIRVGTLRASFAEFMKKKPSEAQIQAWFRTYQEPKD